MRGAPPGPAGSGGGTAAGRAGRPLGKAAATASAPPLTSVSASTRRAVAAPRRGDRMAGESAPGQGERQVSRDASWTREPAAFQEASYPTSQVAKRPRLMIDLRKLELDRMFAAAIAACD